MCQGRGVHMVGPLAKGAAWHQGGSEEETGVFCRRKPRIWTSWYGLGRSMQLTRRDLLLVLVLLAL